jgi:diguanylate cyclase (GGDEF)-like protein
VGPSDRRGWAVWLLRAVLLTAIATFAVGVVVRHGNPGQVAFLDIGVYSTVYLSGGLLLFLQRAAGRRERWAWRALGAAMFLTTGGDLFYSFVLSGMDDPPYPSFADPLYLAWYPLAYLSVLLVLRGRVRRFHASMWLDGLVAGLGAAAFAAAYLVDRVISLTGGSTAEIVVNIAYPTGDILLILVLVGGGAVLGAGISRALAALTIGFILTTTADIVYLLGADTYTEGGPTDLLWLLGVVALCSAPALGQDRSAPAGNETGDLHERNVRARVGWRVMALPALFTVSSLGVIGLSQLDRVPALAGLIADVCVLAALARAVLTFREVRDFADVHRQAHTDDLTGLPNRRALYERCERLIAEASADRPLSMLLFDLDRFKEINDSLGHAGGDALLRLVAVRVRIALRSEDYIARLGGDEFAAVLPDTDVIDAVAVATAIRAALSAPFIIEESSLHVDASVGVATFPVPAATRSELLRCADIAMYQAKQDRTGVRAFTTKDLAPRPDRLRTVEELRGALTGDNQRRNGRLFVHLQPQVRLHPERAFGEAVGVEALVRWDHPVRGTLAPVAFLPLAETAGLLGPLADVVMDLALRSCREWWTSGHLVPVSVNLSAPNVQDPSMPGKIAAVLARHRLPGRALTVELTEDTLMVDPARARSVLDEIRQLGVTVSIDDYGTGYSSLAYLRDLAVDELKLDRAFTANLVGDETAASIVRTTVDLAHSLGLRLVAEGIEDAVSEQILAELGCDIGQGFHIARPMPSAEMLAWLDDRRDAAQGIDDDASQLVR